jgi:hypothetical protein
MIMTGIRPKRQRNVGFEALEGRLALSTGMVVAPPGVHHALARASMHSIPASFKGQVSINGSTLSTTNLHGHIGPDHLTGYGTGTQVGKQFEGGEVFLSNSQGSIQLGLSPTFVIRVGKSKSRTFAITVESATGKYAQFAASTGTITKWNVPDRPNATASFAAVFNI